jgi:hypothetical protein
MDMVKSEIMKTYWCSKKNTMPGIIKDPENYNPPCCHVSRPGANCGLVVSASTSALRDDNKGHIIPRN